MKKFNITDFETCLGLTVIFELVQNPFNDRFRTILRLISASIRDDIFCKDVKVEIMAKKLNLLAKNREFL